MTTEPNQPTVTTKLVGCDYRVEQFCQIDGCACCMDSPGANIPITVQNPSAHSMIMPPQFTANWRPNVMPLMVCQASTSHAISQAIKEEMEGYREHGQPI
jgi:hypothetical protein